MTGIGTASFSTGHGNASIEIRSVNHRFLKISLKLPADLAAYESEIETQLRTRLKRGSVTLSVRTESSTTVAASSINGAIARHYVESARQLATELQLPERDLGIEALLMLPGVLDTDHSEPSPEERLAMAAPFLAGLDAALVALDDARVAEGQALGQVFEHHFARVDTLIGQVAAHAASVPRELRDRTLTRVRALLSEVSPGTTVDESNLLRELCTLADRTDITEELRRAEVHVGRLRQLFSEGGEVGRRVDFLLQELQREVNTMGSKANDSSIAHSVVELKVEVERMKEQVQNLE